MGVRHVVVVVVVADAYFAITIVVIVVARVLVLSFCLHHVTIVIAIVGLLSGAAVVSQLPLEGRTSW